MKKRFDHLAGAAADHCTVTTTGAPSASAIYLRAAQIIAHKRRDHACIALSVASMELRGTGEWFCAERKEFSSFFLGNDTEWQWGTNNGTQRERNRRILALLFMSEIAKDGDPDA